MRPRLRPADMWATAIATGALLVAGLTTIAAYSH